MHLWFTEEHGKDVRYSIKVDNHIYSGRSQYQRIDVIDTYFFGRMLILDGFVMLSEKDECGYHEMMVHVPAFTHAQPKSALVIGGGDGGTVRELLKHTSIERVDLVEIDEQVVEISKRYLPALSGSLSDEKVRVYYEDGIKFVKETNDRYDLVFVDSIDPVGPAVGLFQKEFYEDVFNCLNEDGIMTAQAESALFELRTSYMMQKSLKELYPMVECYQSFIPTYPSGHWMFAIASKMYDHLKDFRAEDARQMEKTLNYYNADLHRSSFSLPNWVREYYKS